MKSATTVFVVAFWYVKSREKPRVRRGKVKLFLDAIHYIKQLNKTSILIKFLNTLIG